MYNPIENENYNEWIELYNPTNKSINISGWTITDNKHIDSIEGNFENGTGATIIPSKAYAIITDHGSNVYKNFNISNNTIKLYVDDRSIGNGLGNSGDKLILKNNENKSIDNLEWIINYSDVDGEAINDIKEGYTLSKINANKTKNSKYDFFEGLPTPGFKNKLLETGKTKITLENSEFIISKDEMKILDLEIKNIGKFSDEISIRIINITNGWQAELDKKIINLEPNQSRIVKLYVTPTKYNSYEGEIRIIALSEKEINLSDEIELYFKIKEPDLYIKQIKLFNETKNESNNFLQGEIIRIKSFCKNQGFENATNVLVTFYIDEKKYENYIGKKTYKNISKYQKYPSILFDTINLKPGNHKIYCFVDENNIINEISENNNKFCIDFEIIDTKPNIFEKKLVFSEFYYHTHPGFLNEFLKIYNPNNKTIDISGFYITNNPEKNKLDQRKIIFPKNTKIKGYSSICISQTAKDFFFETRVYPDFEYFNDSIENISDMISETRIYFGNEYGTITLKNMFNHTIDSIVYGNTTKNISGWAKNPIIKSSEGEIYKRNFNGLIPIDTNTSNDWKNFRIFKIGQTNLDTKIFNFKGLIQTFISPDNSYSVIKKYISSANTSIFLNIYEITSQYLCEELINCLKKNISLTILVEGGPVGGVCDKEKYLLNKLFNYGAKVYLKTSDNSKKIFSRYRFNHAKYLIIDNEVLIVESCNFADTGVPYDPSYGNREWGLVIKNSSVAKYYFNVFLDDSSIDYSEVISLNDSNWKIPYDYYLDYSYYKKAYKTNFETKNYFDNFSVKPIFSPDNSYKEIYELINSSNKSIYVEQLYIYKYWDEKINPFVKLLSEKANQGIDVRVIMNYNPTYSDTNEKINQTKEFLEENNVKVKFIYTNWSIFSNVHNKGVIVDNKSVLISSINWNENSFLNNREAGIIVYNENISRYFLKVFLYDWNLKQKCKNITELDPIELKSDENTIYMAVIFTLTFAVVIQDWRKRKWT